MAVGSCDMKTPICSHCKRRREECNYKDVNRSQIGSIQSSSIGAAAISTNTATTSSANTVDPNIILTHYIDVTSRSMWLVGGDRGEEFNPWREELPPLLQTLPFLYHIIISLSALHMYHRISSATTKYSDPVQQPRVNGNLRESASVGNRSHDLVPSTYSPKPFQLDSGVRSPPFPQPPSSDILTLAYSNQILGSRAFRRAVPSIDANNWVAVMAFTIAVLVFSLYNCQRSTTFSGVVTGTLAALRSAGIMGNELKPFFLGSGAFGEYLMSRARRSAPKVVDPAIVVALAHLRTINKERKVTDSRERAEQSACAQAIDSLQRWVVLVSGKPCSWAHYVWWPADVPTEFVDLVNEKSPVALLVFVYWCAVLGRADQQWFLNGWASKAGGVAMAEMGPGWWGQGLDWPLQELGLCRGSVKIGDLSKGEMLVRL
ncbi:hypothetical protein O1611_g9424 [Lasiodiplodia mahajangana]|uniref:Uncharacterized protein n=1 Tax=Lasiodiplodia mahajangana TaxID=1108764 RepID=A0ACC2J9J3_9PEZI|nr:hypothetical protein O1611_g9424 [Lasiodiplodia mahajangana]